MITRPFGSTGAGVSAIGQGTWRMGESRGAEKGEAGALRLGIELGLTHIDTAEMYADGGAERVVGRAARDRRADVFIAVPSGHVSEKTSYVNPDGTAPGSPVNDGFYEAAGRVKSWCSSLSGLSCSLLSSHSGLRSREVPSAFYSRSSRARV